MPIIRSEIREKRRDRCRPISLTLEYDGRYVVFDSDWDDPETTYAFLIRLPEPAMSHGAALIVIAILALCRRRLGEEPGRRQPERLSRTGCP